MSIRTVSKNLTNTLVSKDLQGRKQDLTVTAITATGAATATAAVTTVKQFLFLLVSESKNPRMPYHMT